MLPVQSDDPSRRLRNGRLECRWWWWWIGRFVGRQSWRISEKSRSPMGLCNNQGISHTSTLVSCRQQIPHFVIFSSCKFFFSLIYDSNQLLLCFPHPCEKILYMFHFHHSLQHFRSYNFVYQFMWLYSFGLYLPCNIPELNLY